MKKNCKKFLALALALCLALSLGVTASAATNEATASGGTATSAVTLSSTDDGSLGGNPAATAMSVTVPAALPISMVDGYIVTATNAVIANNGEGGAVKVTAVDIQPGAYEIGNYANFSATGKAIALSINDCPTEKAGKLTITDESFPVINAGTDLAIRYKAKVSTDAAVTNVNAATVIFTIAAAEPVAVETEAETDKEG